MPGSRIKCLNVFLVPWEGWGDIPPPNRILTTVPGHPSFSLSLKLPVCCAVPGPLLSGKQQGDRQTGAQVLQGTLAFLRLSGKAVGEPKRRPRCLFY